MNDVDEIDMVAGTAEANAGTDMVVAVHDDAGVTAEHNGADIEVEDDVELGGTALRLLDCLSIEGAKGIPAPLMSPTAQSSKFSSQQSWLRRSS